MTVEDFDSGTVTVELHSGHSICFPLLSSRALNFRPHVHANRIVMANP